MRKECKWGDRCKFRHLYDNVEGHRHDKNYDHYGNNHLTGDQNNYRYGDSLDDSWKFVRLNGRHQNKREPHTPNIRKNYNINNKHIYSETYRGYNSHLNSHQGSQMNHSNGKKTIKTETIVKVPRWIIQMKSSIRM